MRLGKEIRLNDIREDNQKNKSELEGVWINTETRQKEEKRSYHGNHNDNGKLED